MVADESGRQTFPMDLCSDMETLGIRHVQSETGQACFPNRAMPIVAEPISDDAHARAHPRSPSVCHLGTLTQ